MYKAYLAGMSGASIEFANLSESEATAFTLGVIDRTQKNFLRCRRQVVDDVARLIDGEWLTERDGLLIRLNQMQAERDKLHAELDVLRPILANFADEAVARDSQSFSDCDKCNGLCECPE